MKAEERFRGQRVVVDTNVWISAALSPLGSPAQFIRLALAVAIPVFSSVTFAELETRIWKPKFDRYLSTESRKRLLHDLNAAAFWCDLEPSPIQKFSRDPDDDKFILTALTAHAPYLVTGDQDLVTVKPFVGLTILTPADALL